MKRLKRWSIGGKLLAMAMDRVRVRVRQDIQDLQIFSELKRPQLIILKCLQYYFIIFSSHSLLTETLHLAVLDHTEAVINSRSLHPGHLHPVPCLGVQLVDLVMKIVIIILSSCDVNDVIQCGSSQSI